MRKRDFIIRPQVDLGQKTLLKTSLTGMDIVQVIHLVLLTQVGFPVKAHVDVAPQVVLEVLCVTIS